MSIDYDTWLLSGLDDYYGDEEDEDRPVDDDEPYVNDEPCMCPDCMS